MSCVRECANVRMLASLWNEPQSTGSRRLLSQANYRASKVDR